MSEQPVDDEKKPEPLNTDASVKKMRRFFSILAILLILIAEIHLYTSVVREDVGMPARCELSLSPISFTCQIDEVSTWINITIILLLAGVLLFVFTQITFSDGYKPPRFMQAFLDRFRMPSAAPWIMAALVLSLLSVMSMLLFEKAKLTNYIPVVTLWFFAAMCYAAAFIKDQFSVSRFVEWVKLHRYELLAIGLVTLLAFVLRFYKLGDVPRVVNGDEGRAGVAALSTNVYPFVNPFSLWENFGALYLQVINLFLTFLGATPFSLRLVAALAGTLAVPAVYLLARQISGHRIALIAAVLMAISHPHLHFSRTVAVAYIQGTWIIPLEFYFLLSGLAKRSSWRAALGGMLLAIHYSVYLDAQIITALILVYMLIAFIFLRPWFKPALRQAAAFWGGFAIMILPELTFIWEHPGDFFERLSKDGMFQSGWLPNEMAKTGAEAYQLLAQRVVHVFLSLFYYPAFDFYGSMFPVLGIISAILFLLGLGIVLWKTNSPGFLLLNGHFWSGVLAIALFSLPASADTYRLLIVLPVVMIVSAVGLDYVLELLGLGWAEARKSYVSLTAAILLSLLVFNLWTYYIDFAGRCVYGNDDGPTRFASYLGNYARGIEMGPEVYLLSDAIYVNGTHQSVAFLSHNRAIANFDQPIDTLQPKPGDVVIASPDRIPELQAWAQAHPEGKVHTEYDCGSLMLYTYQFP